VGPDPASLFRSRISGFGGTPPPPLPNVFGASGASGPGQGAFQAFIPLVSELVRQQTGTAGFTFGSDLNVAGTLFTRQYLENLNAARASGAAADRDQTDQLLRGLFIAAGNRPTGSANGRFTFDASGEAAIRRLGGDLQAVLPFAAAVAPDSVDALFPRGSVAAAASSFANAGRFITGPDGQPLSFTRDAAEKILGPLTAQGPRATAGLGAVRLGQTFEALSAQGLIAGGEGVIERSRDKIGEYSKVVAAINDVFGDAGRTNAPIPELLESLQSLTGGALGRLDAGTVSASVRQLQAAAQLTPGGLAGVGTVAGIAQQQLGAAGGSTLLTAPITAQALAAGGAFANNQLAGRGPQSLTRDQFIELAARQQAAGAASEVGNLFGAILAQGSLVGADTDLGRAAAALRAGATDVKLGDGTTLDLRTVRTDQLAGLAQRSGLDGSSIVSQLPNLEQNQAFLATNPAALRAITSAQGLELRTAFTAVAQGKAGLAGLDLNAVFDAVTAASLTAKNPGDLIAQVTTSLGNRGINLDATQRSALLSTIGDRALGGGGLQQFQLLNPDFQQQVRAGEAAFGARGLVFDLLSPLARGGFGRNFATAVANLGKADGKERGSLDTLITGLGGVGETEVGEALSGPVNSFLENLPAGIRGPVQALGRGLVPGAVAGPFGGAAQESVLGGLGSRPVIINITGGARIIQDGNNLRMEGAAVIPPAR
jgi:hypothetical protein